MGDDMIVKVSYKDRDLNTVKEREYTLRNYASMLRVDVQKVIVDIENAMYRLSGNRTKDEWDDGTRLLFSKIRHKLQDIAGEIDRLPDNLYLEEDGIDGESPEGLFVKDIRRIGVEQWLSNLIGGMLKEGDARGSPD